MFGIGCSIKIQSCISESITLAPQVIVSLVSKIHKLYPRINPGANRIIGDFNPGVQPRGTPITAEVVHGGGVDVNVTWRDEEGRVVSRSWSKASGWDLPNPNGGRLLDGRD